MLVYQRINITDLATKMPSNATRRSQGEPQLEPHSCIINPMMSLENSTQLCAQGCLAAAIHWRVKEGKIHAIHPVYFLTCPVVGESKIFTVAVRFNENFSYQS